MKGERRIEGNHRRIWEKEFCARRLRRVGMAAFSPLMMDGMMLPARHSAAAKSAPFPYNQPAEEEEEG
jgi:hypothetical protein